MSFKTFALAAAAATMLTGAALAQTSTAPTDNTTTNATTPSGSSLEDKTLMGPFYTDESMTTLKTGDEFNTAWMKMSGEDKDRVRADCENSSSLRDDFCQGIRGIESQAQ
jgi:hypothetical protein